MPNSYPVLIADDSEDDLFFLKRALRKAGVKNPITFVINGAEAIDYLENDSTHKTPRVVMLDVKMPLKNGFDVLECVRKNPLLKRLPVIMFSSSAEERDVNRAYDLGANSYVVKPGDTKRWEELVKKIHEYWIDINEKPTIPIPP
jgi:CheY-like chemotaxis protein